MYYIYDDNPSSGYVAVSTVQQEINPKLNFAGIQKKQFNIYKSGFHKSSSQILDTHFKIKKTADQSYVLSSVENKISKEPHRITDSPPQNIAKEVNDTIKVVNSVNSAPSQIEKKNFAVLERDVFHPILRARAYGLPLNIDTYNALSSQRNHLSPNQLNRQDENRNSVEVNVGKILIPSVPHKIKLSNNRQLASVSLHGIANHRHQKMPAAVIIDKTLHKTTNYVDPKFQIMSRFLEGITQKGLEEREIRIDASNKKSKRKVASDNMKKYIGNDIIDPTKQVLSLIKSDIVDDLITETRSEKSKDILTHKTMVSDKNQYSYVRNDNKKYGPVGITNQDEELSDVPYALFYRMNVETLDGESGLVPFDSNQDFTDFMYSTKNKRSKKNATRKKNSNSVRLHKNYRKF